MSLNRRSLLRLLAAAGLGPGLAPRAAPAQAAAADQPGVARPLFVVFTGLTPALPARSLAAAISPFAEQGIPLGFVLDTDAAPPGPDWAGLGGVIAGLAAASPGLAEVIAWAAPLAAEPPYFQIRAATLARARAGAAIAAGAPPGPPPPLLTIACAALPAPAPGSAAGSLPGPAVDGTRAAGFRAVLLLPDADGPAADRPAVAGHCPDRSTCLRGGLRRSFADPAGDTLAALRRAGAARGPALLSLSFADPALAATDLVRDRAAALARGLAAEIGDNRFLPALPREQVQWFASGTERLVALRIEAPDPDDAGAAEARAALADLLRDAGIGVSLSGRSAAGGACDADRATPCRIAADGGAGDGAAEIVVHPAGAPGARSGLDGEGRLHLAETARIDSAEAAAAALRAAPEADLMLSLAVPAWADAPRRAALLRVLDRHRRDTRSACLDLPGYAARLLPEDPVYRAMLATRRDLARAPAATAAPAPATPALAPPERAAFLEDARIAWSYVERLTEPATGLCPSTAQFDGDWSSFYRYLTMWDLGSLIQAVLAAHEIGLIGDDGYRARIGAILAAIPAARIAGLALPPEEIRTDRREISSPGFNACDAGRLLSALHEVETRPLSRGPAAALVGGWDLAGAVRDRQLHSIGAAGFRSSFLSHCAHYTMRALGLWGVDAGSPYQVMRGDSPTDARMRLMYQVARIGAFGAEPLLLEAVEMGLSEPSAWLAEVLATAQERSFAADGQLVCASETPMDRTPWFTAQGLALDQGPAGGWDIQPIDPAPEFRTPEFRAAARVISTKAAFLWAAVRPGPYSDRLLAFVRARARASDAGWSAGVYAASGAAMAGYSDINTNGVILQAIAYALRGRRPRAPA